MLDDKLEKSLHRHFEFGFHLSQEARERYGVARLTGKDDARTAGTSYRIRKLADRINDVRHTGSVTAPTIQPGQLLTFSVVVDVLRYVATLYCHQEVPGVLVESLSWVGKHHGHVTVEIPPPTFVSLYPPVAVHDGPSTESQYLAGDSDGIAHRESVTIEMLLLQILGENPALKPFRDLFDDKELRRRSPFEGLMSSLDQFLATKPAFGPIGQTLMECLRAPMRACPDSLDDQLTYIRTHWRVFLPAGLLERIDLVRDIVREEHMLRGLGPGAMESLRFRGGPEAAELGYDEPARFSRDADWMSNVVILAKSAYVWLDQLTKQYQRPINTLADIPDEELDHLARWGFTGLWLIGLWERSDASRHIKQIMGNPEAVASAYSLYDYDIAADLGGEEAYQNLRSRAWQRGIRLASDMVPNHMGVFSRWVVEHPDWFIQSPHPPFPVYQYTGVDLSSDDRVSVQIEDGYWEHRDAAVVFKRTDKFTGDVRYIYHGNDGTSMPWNDTAQLNFIMPEVREAVIQTILHVARKFPIIRFDAAMTLAKRHYQRLWFPTPGDGGAIPSRAEHGMTKAEFDTLFPEEFWRQVVDRVAAEVPDTLLLAEAFWLMEGYFVRTLGMHRVYNSAFMNMLKMEENGKYRTTVKNVLEFSPEVLKRFVNFMNNPDEATAVAQFGKGDKYYGVAVMMVTMPGLPMFGHGQIQGFQEKYGMEYRRAYWDEEIDYDMVARHEREVFPLMRRRHLFSGSENFALYDFQAADGWVDENVFAYSNRSGDDRAVIIYNNAYAATRGWVRISTPINVGGDDNQVLERRTLGQALALNTAPGAYYRFRDHRTGLQYLRAGRHLAEEGMFAVLDGYQYHAFLDFQEIQDTDGSWGQLAGRLDGRGVHDLDETYREVQLEPITGPFHALLDDRLSVTVEDLITSADSWRQPLEQFYAAALHLAGIDGDPTEIAEEIVAALPRLEVTETVAGLAEELREHDSSGDDDQKLGTVPPAYVMWLVCRHLSMPSDSKSSERPQPSASSVDRFEDWLLRKTLRERLVAAGGSGSDAHNQALLVSILLAHEELLTEIMNPLTPLETCARLFEYPSIREFLFLHQHEGVWWYNRENWETLLQAMLVLTSIRCLNPEDPDKDLLASAPERFVQLQSVATAAGFDMEKTLVGLGVAPTTSDATDDKPQD